MMPKDYWSTPLPPRRRPIGIIDIGSNTVRLVVYDGQHRMPMPLFNEKSTCALGSTLETTGSLNPEGVSLALDAIERFVRLAHEMDVERLDVLATAAARDAADGAAFIEEIERRCAVNVQVLSGEGEARRAAYGVICAQPNADGMVCDLGGGSLELVMVEDMSCGDFTTLPLGVLRLAAHSGGDSERAAEVINKRLDTVSFLGQGEGRTLYAVGGAWRALARVLIDRMQYPLHVLDNFTLDSGVAQRMVFDMLGQNPRALEKIRGISRKRIPNLPLAAQLLSRLIDLVQPDKVVFSVYGMREGQFFLSLPPEMQQGDPLMSAATELACAAGRFPEHAVELMDWMSPLFPDETAHLRRLRHAACLLGDIFWNEHPDYRAEQALLRVLRLPFMGLDHRDRAGLGLAVYFRYSNDDSPDVVRQAMGLLDKERIRRVRAIGAALRLAHTLSGGIPGLLSRTSLERGDQILMLGVPIDDALFQPGPFEKRLDRLAQAMDLSPSLVRV